MLEQVRIEEVRDVQTVEVLDAALVPQSASRPNTPKSVLAAGVLSLILGILLAFFLSYLERLRAREAVSGPSASVAENITEVDGNGDQPGVYPLSPKETERIQS